MKPGARAQGDPKPGRVECRTGILEKLCITQRLYRRVQDLSHGAADDGFHAVVPLTRRDFGPLLQLDQDRGRLSLRRFPKDQRVETSGARGQLHLEDNAVVTHIGVAKLRRKRGQRVLPRIELRPGRAKPIVRVKRVAELLRDPLLNGFIDELFTGARVELHPSSKWGNVDYERTW
jgi:hypothetical protein